MSMLNIFIDRIKGTRFTYIVSEIEYSITFIFSMSPEFLKVIT